MRRWNGWGIEGTEFPIKQKGLSILDRMLQGRGCLLPDAELSMVKAAVPPSRLPPHSLVSTDPELRIRHARGESFPDWVAKHSGKFGRFPDGVALPEDCAQVRELLNWAHANRALIIIYGGGTSVAGHVNVPDSIRPVLTLSLERMNQLIDLNRESQIATFGAGTPGPRLEELLRREGYTLGHFPQSWELSTVGGWVASRSSGQQSLRYGRIEQLFAGGRMETLQGTLIIPDIPASAAGPDIREIVLGSEGRLGALTEVKVRVTPLAEHEAFHVAFFPNWDAGLRGVRELVQGRAGLSMMRLSNPLESTAHLALSGDHPLFDAYDAYVSALGCRDGMRCMITFGVTGTRRQAAEALGEAKRLIRRLGGVTLGSRFIGNSWEHSRFRSPYFRNGLWTQGYSADTFETCINWDKVTPCMQAMEQAIRIASGSHPVFVFSHLSHTYPQGCSIYTTYIFKNSDSYDELLDRWTRYKTAAGNAMAEMGATVSHQHGVGRDHARWLPFEKGEIGMDILRAIITRLDPDAQMNPGCLLQDPPGC